MSRAGFPPIIITGAQRSGTSLLAHLLQQLGLFIGKEFKEFLTGEQTYEATYFLGIEGAILGWSFGKAVWGMPWFSDPAKRKLVCDYMRVVLNAEHVAAYLGTDLFKKFRTPFELRVPWGWKSPTSIHALPLWLNVFPGAKIVYIYRNGVAAARSEVMLRSRETNAFRGWVNHWLKLKSKGMALPRDSVFLPALRVSKESVAVKRWLFYWEYVTKAADEALAKVPRKNQLSIKFESLIENPASVLEEACEFIGLSVSPKKIKAIAKTVKAEQLDAFLRDPKYRKIYNSFKKKSPQMITYGYDKL